MSESHSPAGVRPGRYTGGNDAVELELRVDPELGIISGDLRQGRLAAAGDAAGRLELAAGDAPDRLAVSLEFDRRLGGLPFRRPIEVMVDWSSAALRDLAVELETESGVTPIADFSVNGSVKNLTTVLREPGSV